VVKSVKFRSNLTEADPYTAENAILNEDPREDTKLTSQKSSIPLLHTFSFHSNLRRTLPARAISLNPANKPQK